MKYLKYATMITAHAGSEGTRPNSLESIREMSGMGVDCIEIDVHTRDGVQYMHHDSLAAGVHYDTLEDAFRIIAAVDDLWVNIDLKHEGQIRAIEALAARCGMAGRILFTGSVGDEEIPYVKERGLIVWYNHQLFNEEQAKTPIESAEAKGFQVLNTNYNWVSDEMVAEKPRQLSIWTVKHQALMRQYLEVGIVNITTRMPKLALKLREEIQGC